MQSKRRPLVSIIVVTHNAWDYTQQCLESILVYVKGIDYEIVVVDNASSDSTPDRIKAQFPCVHLIENSVNLGFATANNLAIKSSRAEYFLLINSDAAIIEGNLADLLAHMERDQTVGILGCKIIYPDGTIQTSNNAFPNLFTELLHVAGVSRLISHSKSRAVLGRYLGRVLGRTINEYLRVHWDSERVRCVDWVSAACMLVRREAAEDAGLLDEHFFMYYEDADWCLRMTQKGWRVLYSPSLTAVHHVGGETRKLHPLANLERNRSRLYYHNKHFPVFHRAMLRLLLIASTSVQVLRSLLSPVDRRRFTTVLRLMLSYPLIQ